MKKQNPNIVLEAITDSQNTIGNLTIYDISISRYAFLEMLESPFIEVDKKFEMTTIIPSIYVLAIEKEQLKKYNSKNLDQLKLDALDWADENLTVNDIPDAVKLVMAKFQAINQAAPDNTPSDSKKKQ